MSRQRAARRSLPHNRSAVLANRQEREGRQRAARRRNTSTRHRRTAWVAVTLAAVVLAVVVFAVIAAKQPSSPPPSQGSATYVPTDPESAAYLPTGPILTVNTDPIDSREFLLQMGTNRAEVFQYFYDHYGVQDSATFWTTPHGGVTPLTMIKQLTTQQLVQLTVQLEMARARGLVGDISYGTMLANMQQENQRRATAVAQHQSVYGLTSFTDATYFSYVTSNVEVNLKQNLEQAMPPPATAVLERLYGQLRSQDFACSSPSQGQAISQYCPDGQKYLPFAAVESQVLQDWKESQVEALISANIRAARVQINHTVFDKVVAE
jgi:hypothetical protein